MNETQDDRARLLRVIFWLDIAAAAVLFLNAFTAVAPTSTVLFIFGLTLIYNAVRLSINYHRTRRDRP